MARRRNPLFSGFTLHRLEDRLAPAITADLPTWLPAGPAPTAGGFSQVPAATDASGTSPANNTSGSLVASAPDPLNPNILFVASPNGGIWRTTNATQANPTWTNLTDRLPSQSMSAMDVEVSPDLNFQVRRLLAGTGAVTDARDVAENLATGDRIGLVYTQDALSLDGKGNYGQPLFQLIQGPTASTFTAPFQTTDGLGNKVTLSVPVTVGYPAGAFVGTNIRSVATRSYTPSTNPFTPPRAATGTAYLLAATERGLFIADRLSDGTVTAFRPLNGQGGLPAATVQLVSTLPVATYGFQNPINPLGITDLTVDPADPKRVWASGQFGVFRTNDITAANVVWIDVSAQLTAAAGLPAATPLITATTNRVKVAVHGGLTGPNDPNVVYVAVANPAPVGTSSVVSVLWSTDQAALVQGKQQGSQFAGTFTLMDEPVQLSVDLRQAGAGPITDASNAKPVVLAVANSGLSNGDRVLVEGVQGNGGANGVFTVSGVSATNVTLDQSAATGKYQAGTGVLRQVLGLLPDGRADVHFSLAADPLDPNLVYIGGTYYNRPTYTGGRPGFASSAVLFRGDRSRPFLGGFITQAIIDADTTFQWTPLTDNKAAYVVNPQDKAQQQVLEGTSPTSDTRAMTFDANNNLIEVSDGGVFRRTNPRQNGRIDPTDPFEPTTASNNRWASVNGNLQINETLSTGFDPLGRATFNTAANTGHSRQTEGGTNIPPAAGGTVQIGDEGTVGTLGDVGNVFQFVTAVDNLSQPGNTIRYYETYRMEYDGTNNRISGGNMNLGAVADNGFQKALSAQDKVTGLIVAPNSTRPQVSGSPSPAAGTILIGGFALYEDNDPSDPTGFIVGDITPTGYTGQANTVVYGGRQPGVNGVFVPTPRVAYVGTSTGQLWVRRSVGGFVNVGPALDALSGTNPTNVETLSVVTDPDDWRVAYVLRSGFEQQTYTFFPPGGGTGTGTTFVRRDRIFQTRDGGVSFTDITGTLVATGTVVGNPDGTPTLTGQLDAQGNPANGLTTRLFTLALYDGDPFTPRYVNGQDTFQDALLAGGRGGVYRLIALPDGNGGRLQPSWTEFGTGLPNIAVRSVSVGEYQYVTPDGQTRRGVGIAAGTLGRGTYVIPDAAAIAPSTLGTNNEVPFALAAASVRIDGVTAAGAQPLAGRIVADVNNPAFVTVSDGVGSTATYERTTIQGFNFVGSAGQVDRVDIVAGTQAGGDLNFIRFPVSVDLGNTKGDFVRVDNGNKTTPTVVTIATETINPPVSGGLRPVIEKIGFGPTDNLFNTARGGGLRLSGLDQGTVELDLGSGSSVANSIFVQGTKAAVTRVIGGVGIDATNPARGDTFLVNSNAGFIDIPVIDFKTGKQATDPNTGAPVFVTVPGNITGTLDNLLGDLEIFGPPAAAGKYKLQLSDQGATTGNNGVILGRDGTTGLGTVLNLGGPTGSAAIRYSGVVGDLNVRGSDAAGVNQAYTVADPVAPLTLFTGNGPATLNIQSLTRTASLSTGPSNDLIQVGSRAGVNNDASDLSKITVALNLEAGAGDNRLVVSNSGSPVTSNVTVTRNSITGASAGAVNYVATGGRFVDPLGGAGILYLGSNTAADQITLASALKNSQTTIDGRGGPDSITVLGDDTQLADIVIRGGGGGDTTTVVQGVFGLLANSLQVIGTGPDSLIVQGYDQKFRTDTATLRVDSGGKGSVFVDGGVTDTRFSGVRSVTFDGLAGRSNLSVVDNTGVAYGSPSDPASGIVVAPLGESSGTVRIGTLDPIISFRNVTGSDADGLVIVGDPTGSGKFNDTLTVVGPSETGLGGTGNLAGLTAATADSTITVSDRQVVFERSAVGPLRSVALGRVNGKSTISNLVVLAGNQSKQGDQVTVVPSREVNILVDGQGPARSGTAGNVLTVGTDAAFTLSSTTSPALGGQQTRVETEDGASFGYRGFGRLVGGATSGRSIYAVGADIGGGPRVRVYDALSGDVLFDQFVYEPTFTGGVRVATGDVTGDGVPDLITAAGPGGGPRVSVYDGVTFKVVSSFFAYETTFTGGMYLAVGDLDGNGFGEIVTGTGVGGGPLVKAFDQTGRLLTAVFAFEDTFRGGVRVAVGDVSGDGKADIITTAGPGGGPVIRVFDPTTLQPLLEYFQGDANLRSGLAVAAGDLTGDGLAEIITGPASGPVSVATVRRGDGTTLDVTLFEDQPADATPAATGTPNDVGGVRLATADADSEGVVKVFLAARGPGFPSKVYRYFIDPVQSTDPTQAFEDQFVGGVWVG